MELERAKRNPHFTQPSKKEKTSTNYSTRISWAFISKQILSLNLTLMHPFARRNPSTTLTPSVFRSSFLFRMLDLKLETSFFFFFFFFFLGIRDRPAPQHFWLLEARQGDRCDRSVPQMRSVLESSLALGIVSVERSCSWWLTALDLFNPHLTSLTSFFLFLFFFFKMDPSLRRWKITVATRTAACGSPPAGRFQIRQVPMNFLSLEVSWSHISVYYSIPSVDMSGLFTLISSGVRRMYHLLFFFFLSNRS